MIFFYYLLLATGLTYGVVDSRSLSPRAGDKCLQTAKPVCKKGQEQDGMLCYPICRDGYHGVGPVCWANKGIHSYGRTAGNNNFICPDGFRMMQVGPEVPGTSGMGCGKKVC